MRSRATKAEVEARRDALWAIVAEGKPMTVRQVFYQATVAGIVEKTEAGYDKVQTDLVQMRKAGSLPYCWLADNTRWQRKPRTFDSVEQALQETARFYRKALWADADCYVEIWLEKDALSGVVYPVTDHVRRAADGGARLCQPVVPAQRRRIHQRARCPGLHLSPRRLRSVRRQCRREDRGDAARAGARCRNPLRAHRGNTSPDRALGSADPADQGQRPRSKGFGDVSVELDAIPPNTLRAIVEDAINRHNEPRPTRSSGGCRGIRARHAPPPDQSDLVIRLQRHHSAS